MAENELQHDPNEATEAAKQAMGVSPNAQKMEDVNTLGSIVTQWHYNMILQLHHKLRMPEDVGIDIPTGETDGDGKDIVIDGNADHKAGFLAGINYALELLDTFPIKGVPVDADEQPANETD